MRVIHNGIKRKHSRFLSLFFNSLGYSFLLFPLASLFSLEVIPWLPQPYQPQLFGSYTYSTYRDVANAVRQLSARSHDQELQAGIGLATMTHWALDLDVEFARTPRFDFGFRSVGAQIRKQLYNDIGGDFLSFTPGLLLRIVPPKALRDVSTPYHYQFNGEVNLALGKEWSQEIYWRCRLYNFTGFGIANRGSPWVRSLVALGLNREDQLEFQTSLWYDRGFGDQTGVNTSPSVFKGWKSIDHRSLDIGVSFRYLFRYWGSFTFEVRRRLYARSFPEKVTFFLIRYELPLSF